MTPEDDKRAIREVIETWAVARDAGLWDELAATWHDGGRMRSTWFDGPASDFVVASRAGFERGVTVHHFLGGSLIDVVAARAIAQTKMILSQRTHVDGVECDVVCTGRFFDFLLHRDARWAIASRRAIYEKDRIDPTEPGAVLDVDRELLGTFPSGCHWLLYAQHRAGLPVIKEQAGLRGEAVEALYAAGKTWLRGGRLPTP